eukprot:TRINITY_DN22357_c0_g1_i1.p1 TRINITY_DN22357_c0_g1~~TRINITY_DN22357_c0_g1_i1.p1  ORF type:complete len:704 (+),score=274.18 TRINITY_DN22357_c0_g1_i1:61-2112(+)
MVAGGGASDVYRKEGYYASGKKDGRRVVLVLTSSEKKRAEFTETLADMYGCRLVFRSPAAACAGLAGPRATQEDVAAGVAAVREIVAGWDEPDTASPQFVLWEECTLRDMRTQAALDPQEVVAAPGAAPAFLADTSFLALWRLTWKEGKLAGIEYRYLEHANKGYVDPALAGTRTAGTFGWDHVFVLPHLGVTYDELKRRRGVGSGGKIAARQVTLDSFVHKYLIYTRPKALTHHRGLAPRRAVEFTEEMSVARFVRSNACLSNAALGKWGLERFQQAVLDKGIFFRAATSRPMGNYFTPPLGGVPLTAKKDAVEETVFMMHDVGHQYIPDLVYTGGDLAALPPAEAKAVVNVYCVWRMMSEGTTLVMGDCLYADTLATANPAWRPCLDTRIYPLFKATVKKASGGTAAAGEAPASPPDVLGLLEKMLWANNAFALVGDVAPWRALLDDPASGGDQATLAQYVAHFEKFFVGDHVWTLKNFTHMTANHAEYARWAELVGGAQFSEAGLPTITEVVAALRARGVDVSGALDATLVRGVFDYMFETLIRPVFSSEDGAVAPASDEARTSRAFRRYMIGQMFLYARFAPLLPAMQARGEALAARLRGAPAFDAALREELLAQYAGDVRYVWGMGLISASAAASYIEICPIFDPVYVTYGNLPYKTVAETLAAIHPAEATRKRKLDA